MAWDLGSPVVPVWFPGWFGCSPLPSLGLGTSIWAYVGCGTGTATSPVPTDGAFRGWAAGSPSPGTDVPKHREQSSRGGFMARWLQQKHPRDTLQSPLMGKGPSDLTADNCPPPSPCPPPLPSSRCAPGAAGGFGVLPAPCPCSLPAHRGLLLAPVGGNTAEHIPSGLLLGVQTRKEAPS